MPHLDALPSTIGTYEFGANLSRLPSGSKYLRLLCNMLSWPLLDSGGSISSFLRRELDVPKSTSFYPGFKCLVGNLHCGKDVGLCDTFFVDYVPVYIGDHVGFSFRNIVITSTHSIHDFNRIICRPVVVEKNVWITSNVTILSGVRIGENSVIGAGSVVSRDIPPNVFAGGNPCKPIKAIQRGY